MRDEREAGAKRAHRFGGGGEQRGATFEGRSQMGSGTKEEKQEERKVHAWNRNLRGDPTDGSDQRP